MPRPIAILFPALALAAVGCESTMYKENLALHQQNQELQQRLDASNAQLREAPDAAQYRQLQAALLDRDQKLADVGNAPPPAGPPAGPVPAADPGEAPPKPSRPPGIAGLETSFDARAGTVTVTLPGDVLFESGKADLKPGSKATLDKVAAAIKRTYPGKPIRVEGHTDADPITKTKSEWEDNLDLSLTRAAAVTRYLEQQGILPKSITTSGFGEFHPRGSDKKKNRRVEIVVVAR